MIFLLGSPRSGTSWLGNIFDSHPDTLYRHEPDTISRGDYPVISDKVFLAEATQHLSTLPHVRNIKAAGSRPVFRKAYLSYRQWLVRKSIIYAAKGLGAYVPAAAQIHVPDFVDVDECQVTIKSVSLLGRVKSISKVFPDARFVLIVRHPCGHIDSILRGRSQGFLPSEIPLGFTDLDLARHYGIDRADLESAAPHIRAAWRWAILNENAMRELPNLEIVVYEELCQDALKVTTSLFEKVGLSISTQTEAFILQSTASDGTYFQTFRDPMKAANRWKSQFEQIDEVIEAIGHTKPYDLFRTPGMGRSCG
jgi:sulfotransferase family protein